jgi:hypothetical protein
MATVINGDYTILEVIQFTQKMFPTRYEYRDRDVNKNIQIKKVVELKADRKNQPTIKYEISTRSYPQYKPYNNWTGKKQNESYKQRKYKHNYESILTMDRLSLNTKAWSFRLGSMKIIKPAPQHAIKQLRRETLAKWKRIYKDPKVLKKKITAHKKIAPYLTDGDWQAQVQGINLDFVYRDAFALQFHKHLYGRSYYQLTRPSKLNPRAIPFFPKHTLRIIEILMQQGILVND